jgi:hypothetical protein
MNSIIGIGAVWETGEIVLKHIITSDSKSSIFTLTDIGSGTPRFKLTHSTLVGLGLLNCPECYKHNMEDCSKNNGLKLG